MLTPISSPLYQLNLLDTYIYSNAKSKIGKVQRHRWRNIEIGNSGAKGLPEPFFIPLISFES